MENDKKLIEDCEVMDFILDVISNNLCDKAKDLLSSCMYYAAISHKMIIDNICSLTPIEQIYLFSLLFYSEFSKLENTEHSDISKFVTDEIEPQKHLKINNHCYILDFEIDLSNFVGYDLKYAIELDGFDYHSSKKQINYDYEREQSIMSEGYKVIRFTGSQIYNEPIYCAYKTFKIIESDIRRYSNGK